MTDKVALFAPVADEVRTALAELSKLPERLAGLVPDMGPHVRALQGAVEGLGDVLERGRRLEPAVRAYAGHFESTGADLRRALEQACQQRDFAQVEAATDGQLARAKAAFGELHDQAVTEVQDLHDDMAQAIRAASQAFTSSMICRAWSSRCEASWRQSWGR